MNNAPRYLVPSAFNPNEHLVLKDAAPPLEPYDHQRATWDGMTRHYLEAARPAGMVVLPTGGGKTIVAAHWLLRNVVAKGGRVLWLAPRRGLLRQAFATFKRLGNLAHPDKKKLDLIAVSGEGMKWSNVSPDHDVIFASVQYSVLENNRGFVQELLAQRSEPPFVVIDEAHHAVAPQTLSLLAELKRSGRASWVSRPRRSAWMHRRSGGSVPSSTARSSIRSAATRSPTWASWRRLRPRR